jgi:hypothetical protein
MREKGEVSPSFFAPFPPNSEVKMSQAGAVSRPFIKKRGMKEK